jgi:hypothetical protein
MLAEKKPKINRDRFFCLCTFLPIFKKKIACMKKLSILIPLLLIAGITSSSAQIFWTENFESGSTSGKLANTYVGPNGAWTTTSTGANDGDANVWYVSCAENGHTTGVCGTGCVAVSPTATLATLHVGSSAGSGGDMGASYNAGGLCPLICVNTNMRAESPTINCASRTGITIHFYYTENGDGTNDDATLWYYDGSTWSMLYNTPKTPPICPGGQGYWDYKTVSLPSSADHNPNVKIGFNWTNNDDGVGTDPSFAVDSVYLTGTLSAPPAPVASFTSTPTPATICQDSCITLTSTSTIASGSIDSIRWVGVYLGIPILLGNTNPYKLCATTPYNIPGTYTFRLRVYGNGQADSATGTLTVNANPYPIIKKVGKTLSVTGTYSSYQWSNSSGNISGATSSSYTYSGAGTSYYVTVDSGGCSATSAAVSTVGVASFSLPENEYWVTRGNGSALVLHASDPLDGPLTISIYDATGRKVLTGKWDAGNNIKEINDISSLPGLYIIRLSNSSTSAVLKWMK